MHLKRSIYLVAQAGLHLCLRLTPCNALRIALLRFSGMKIGKRTFIARGIRVDFPWKISIGENCYISRAVYLDGRAATVTIGNSVDISSEAAIYSQSHNIYDEGFSPKSGPVRIGDRAWIGTRVIVLPGTEIADGCVIGASSVIGKTTERFSLYVGNPAQRVKPLPETRASRVRQDS